MLRMFVNPTASGAAAEAVAAPLEMRCLSLGVVGFAFCSGFAAQFWVGGNLGFWVLS